MTWADPTSADNCGVTSFTSSHSSGASFNVGTTTVTYTAQDAAGNTTTASFTVTVTDNESPVITGNPGDLSANNDAGICGAAVTWTAPTATDNCSQTLTSTHSPGDLRGGHHHGDLHLHGHGQQHLDHQLQCGRDRHGGPGHPADDER